VQIGQGKTQRFHHQTLGTKLIKAGNLSVP